MTEISGFLRGFTTAIKNFKDLHLEIEVVRNELSQFS